VKVHVLFVPGAVESSRLKLLIVPPVAMGVCTADSEALLVAAPSGMYELLLIVPPDSPDSAVAPVAPAAPVAPVAP